MHVEWSPWCRKEKELNQTMYVLGVRHSGQPKKTWSEVSGENGQLQDYLEWGCEISVTVLLLRH